MNIPPRSLRSLPPGGLVSRSGRPFPPGMNIPPRSLRSLPPGPFPPDMQSDDALLDEVQRETFAYFLHEVNERNGLVADCTRPGWPCAVSHGCEPESGFLPYRWQGYCEALLLYALGLGSPTYRLAADAYRA